MTSIDDLVVYRSAAQKSVSLDKLYIVDLNITGTGSDITCAIATSNSLAEVYKIYNGEFVHLSSLKGHTQQISNVKFSSESSDLLYTSSLDGKLKLWDLRTGRCSNELKGGKNKPLSCMDVSCTDRIICAGTDLVEGDAFLLFWDLRSSNLLGGYWESHTDDITSTAFHPTQSDSVLSSSTDGIVNLFDLKQPNEDDALLSSFNTESSVAKVRWNGEETLSVVTHVETVQMWQTEGAAPEAQWSREQLAGFLSVPDDSAYIVDVHRKSPSQLVIVSGSSSGNGDSAWVLPVTDGSIESPIPLAGNRGIIRTSSYISQENTLITGGESGCLHLWKPSTVPDDRPAATGNAKIGKKIEKLKRKSEPY